MTDDQDREVIERDIAWLHKFITCTPFGEHAPPADVQRAHDIVSRLAREALELRKAYSLIRALDVPPHTLASENADRYIGFGDAVSRCLELLDAARGQHE